MITCVEKAMWVRQGQLPAFSNPKIRVGLVGAGFVSAFHLRALKGIPRAKVVGIADIIPERAKDRAEKFGIPRSYSSLEQLLEDDFDVLHVATPGPTHFELALKGLEAGRHLFVEKPFTTTVEEADRLMAEAEARNLRIIVDHSLLGDPQMARGREHIQRGRIGDVHSVQVFRSGHPPRRSPVRTPYPGIADPLREVGMHTMYCATSIMGSILDASVRARSTGKQPDFQLDEWSISLECERGFAHINLTWAGPVQQVIRVRGGQGQLSIDLSSGLVLTRKNWAGPKQFQLAVNPIYEAATSVWQIARRVGSYLAGGSRWYQGIHDTIQLYYKRLLAGDAMPYDYDHARNVVHWVDVLAKDIEDRFGHLLQNVGQAQAISVE